MDHLEIWNFQIILCLIWFNVYNLMCISMEMWFLSRRLQKQRNKLYKKGKIESETIQGKEKVKVSKGKQ